MLILVPVAKVTDNKYQRRTEYGGIEELANDILKAKDRRAGTLGLMQVPSGRWSPHAMPSGSTADMSLWPKTSHGVCYAANPDVWSGVGVELAFGHRRLRAFRALVERGHTEYRVMPVDIHPLTDEAMLDEVAQENNQRRDLSAIEMAEMLATGIEVLGCTQAELAKRWGVGRSSVANKLRLLDLPDSVKAANRSGVLSGRKAEALVLVAKVAALQLPQKWDNSLDPLLPRHWWRSAPHPDIIIQAVIDNDCTSDQVRASAERLLSRIGHIVPGAVAKKAIVPFDGVVAEKCAGCAYLIKSVCVQTHGTCLDAKKKKTGKDYARKAASGLNLVFSDNPDHFDAWTDFDGEARQLAQAYNADMCNHIVVGFCTEWAVRPSGSVSSPAELGELGVWENLDQGLAIGCTHSPKDTCWTQADLLSALAGDDETAQAAADKKSQDDAAATYGKSMIKKHMACLRKARKHLQDEIALQLDAECSSLEIMTGIYYAIKQSTIHDVTETAKIFARDLIGGYPRYKEDAVAEFKTLSRLADAFGLGGSEFIDDGQVYQGDIVTNRVERLLGSWLGLFYWRHDRADEMIELHDRTQAWLNNGGKPAGDFAIAWDHLRRIYDDEMAKREVATTTA